MLLGTIWQYKLPITVGLGATNCEEFREMKMVRYAKYVGTMIGLEGHIHRWTAPRKKSFSEHKKFMHPQKVWLRDCVTLESMPNRFLVTLDPYPHQTKPLSRLRPMPYSALSQAHTMPVPPNYCVLVPHVALDPTLLGSTLSASRPAIELPPTRTRTSQSLSHCADPASHSTCVARFSS